MLQKDGRSNPLGQRPDSRRPTARWSPRSGGSLRAAGTHQAPLGPPAQEDGSDLERHRGGAHSLSELGRQRPCRGAAAAL
jgi:hypothetical protein